MARKVIQSPLQGAAPGLQPTARPIAIPIGATPPAQRSPMMELAEAFGGFNQELRDLLRDTAAREERDAMALGELEAMKQGAAKRMGEIEDTIKAEVDAGRVSHVRLPSFEKGFRMRAGKDLAQSLFQERLTARLSEATQVEGRVDPEQIIAETYGEVSKQIHESDFFARAAFDDTAQGVIAGFRQQAAAGYTAAYKAAAEQRMSDEGSEIVLQLGQADEAEQPALRASVRTHLDTLRKELPVSEVNRFFLLRTVKPAVEKLIQEGDLRSARSLLHELEDLDVTGKGGLLGKTSDAKALLYDPSEGLFAKIEREARVAEAEAWQKEQRRKAALQDLAEEDAVRDAMEARKAASGMLQRSQLPGLLESYRQKHASDPAKIRVYERTMEDIFDREERTLRDDGAIADFLVSFDSVKPDDINIKEAALEAMKVAGKMSPEAYYKAKEKVKSYRSLADLITERDQTALSANLYAYTPDPAIPPTINFGGTEAEEHAAGEQWKRLDGRQRVAHEVAVLRRFRSAFFDELRTHGTLEEARTARPDALKNAQLEARSYARSLLREMAGEATASTATPASGKESTGTQTPTKAEKTPDPALSVVPTKATEADAVDRRRDAFKAWFRDLGRVDPWNAVAGAGGAVGKFAKDEGSLVGRYATDEEVKARVDAIRPGLIFQAVRGDYRNLLAYPIDSDQTSEGYVKRLTAFAENLRKWGGAEYLSPEQLRAIGLKSEAFQNVGTKAGRIQ